MATGDTNSHALEVALEAERHEERRLGDIIDSNARAKDLADERREDADVAKKKTDAMETLQIQHLQTAEFARKLAAEEREERELGRLMLADSVVGRQQLKVPPTAEACAAEACAAEACARVACCVSVCAWCCQSGGVHCALGVVQQSRLLADFPLPACLLHTRSSLFSALLRARLPRALAPPSCPQEEEVRVRAENTAYAKTLLNQQDQYRLKHRRGTHAEHSHDKHMEMPGMTAAERTQNLKRLQSMSKLVQQPGLVDTLRKLPSKRI
jgi:hypothetical protein